MANEQVVEQPVAEVIPPAADKKKYSFQPKDEEGRPLGGIQVIEYESDQELADKLAKNYEEAQRHIRKLRRDMKLGNYEQESIPEDLDKVEDVDFSDQP